jgi:hypothetical protein
MAKLIVTTRSIQQHRRGCDSKYFIKVRKKGGIKENLRIDRGTRVMRMGRAEGEYRASLVRKNAGVAGAHTRNVAVIKKGMGLLVGKENITGKHRRSWHRIHILAGDNGSFELYQVGQWANGTVNVSWLWAGPKHI